MRIIGALLAVLLGLLGSGCSAVRLSYNHFPELGYWWLDSYLDFNDTQSLQVRADLNALQAWHRGQELPIYIGTLQKLQQLAPAKVTPEQLCVLYDELKPRLQAVLDQSASSILSLAPTLTPEQLNHLERQLDKRRQKWRAEWIERTPEERRARRVKQLVDRAEMFYGRLDPSQLAALGASVAATGFDASQLARESLRRHQDLLQTLRLLQSGALAATKARAEVDGLFERWLDSPDMAYRNYQKGMADEGCKAFAKLHNSSTPSLRQQAIGSLKDYERDARSLMGSRP